MRFLVNIPTPIEQKDYRFAH